ncbi:MBL fold metallo-hydrolase [Aneurinibacillus migulanus]|uniref:Glyoxylase, beta-lactamase superfamily II n=1 Tax=Aneurinibacillus migulanus TaxID=47500 RepID=A0A0D1XQI7_ANEMI|nr:MBL fold metallo-hydrolase [Aneurinibacillus migulanus]KIV56566.1 metallo-beta-lactamasee [Aneurinibacillus migulanus]KON95325.1 metallo-beta-lactamasee [Aneurinibacillus migulanus]MED0893729.1 MBL fold metallo-hydrolase [Aneurinibacillus migulanus]MED1617767.1 MBL fold metallo-hydrolase [Aneurinibacillus migulanus]MED4728392.1 MBL fold metallo-hydrolase [Aneurinibacillus migulanus]
MSISKEGFSVYPVIVPTKYSLRSFNFYLLEEAGSLSLIDAGINSEECWEYFMQTMNENGFTLHDLTRIIITHNHEDHVGLINRISSIKEIPLYAHQESIHRLKRDKGFFSLRIEFFDQLYREMGCGAAGEQQVQKLKDAVRKNEKNRIQTDIITFAEADRIAGLQVIETPGHSPDHVVLLHEQKKCLFAGDHLISHISSNALVEPDRDGERILTLVEYVDSLKKCLQLDVEILYPGHGELINNHKELITKRLHRIDEKAERILRLIQSGISTANQLAYTYYKGKYESQFPLVMSEIIGHLDYLETQHKVQKEVKDGVWHYYAYGKPIKKYEVR